MFAVVGFEIKIWVSNNNNLHPSKIRKNIRFNLKHNLDSETLKLIYKVIEKKSIPIRQILLISFSAYLVMSHLGSEWATLTGLYRTAVAGETWELHPAEPPWQGHFWPSSIHLPKSDSQSSPKQTQNHMSQAFLTLICAELWPQQKTWHTQKQKLSMCADYLNTATKVHFWAWESLRGSTDPHW